MGRIEKTGMYTANPNKRLPVGEKTSKGIVIIYARLVQQENISFTNLKRRRDSVIGYHAPLAQLGERHFDVVEVS